MNKFLTVLISAIMLLSICLFTGCEKANITPSTKAKVELIGIESSVYNPDEVIKKQSMKKAFAVYADNVEAEEPTDSDEILTLNESETEGDNLFDYTGYIAVYKNQNIINFTIKLSNPEDYYIMDFSLNAENEEVEYLTSEGTWKSIKDRTIRWMSSDNETCTYQLKLLNKDTTPSKIKILSMYYSDRRDGTNKTAVNLNNKETYTIYKVDDNVKNNLMSVKNVKNTIYCKEIEFELEVNDKVKIDRIYTYETGNITPENNIYKVVSNVGLFIDYSYYLSENVILKGTKNYGLDSLQIDFKGPSPLVKSMKIGNDEKYYDYYCLNNIQIGGFGMPENYWETNEYTKTTLVGYDSEVYIAWKEEIIFIKIPDGKNAEWCKEQNFTLFGQELNIGNLTKQMIFNESDI